MLLSFFINPQQLLHSSCFKQYEVSAYAQSQKICQHNLNYWQFGDYLAIGAGAHGKITDSKYQQMIRFCNVKNPKDYLNPEKPFLARKWIVPNSELPLEFMMNALRLNQPISNHLFFQRTGIEFFEISQALLKCQSEGFLQLKGDDLYLTNMGKRFLNEVLTYF